MELKQVKRYDSKTVQQLLKIAQKWFNTYIRERDKKDGYFVCISCHMPKGLDQIQAGHFLSMGHHSKTRFDEDNCHSQCKKCNLFLSGNQIGYRIGLVNKIGLERVIALEEKSHQIVKWDRYTLIDLIETYKNKVKDLKHQQS